MITRVTVSLEPVVGTGFRAGPRLDQSTDVNDRARPECHTGKVLKRRVGRTGPETATSDRTEALRHAVFESPGRTEPAAREAAGRGGALPEPAKSYAAKVRDESYRITDDDLAKLAAAGLGDDEVFELTVAAAVGAALHRFEAGMRALRAEG
jgi:hypothetical protein